MEGLVPGGERVNTPSASHLERLYVFTSLMKTDKTFFSSSLVKDSFCLQEVAPPASGGEGSVAGGELPAQTPTSEGPLSAGRIPDPLPADRTGTKQIHYSPRSSSGPVSPV